MKKIYFTSVLALASLIAINAQSTPPLTFDEILQANERNNPVPVTEMMTESLPTIKETDVIESVTPDISITLPKEETEKFADELKPLYNLTSSQFYEVQHPFSKTEGSFLSKKMDAFFVFFNGFFHFDTNQLATPLKIKIFATKEDFNLYLTGLTETDSSFIFIQYSDSAQSELVGYLDENEDFNSKLQHYAFIQFFRTFVKNPPLWIEKGFSVYFEKSKYRENREQIYYKENLTWLNNLKEIINAPKVAENTIPLDTLLFMDEKEVKENTDKFYAQSWGLVNFLLNYPNAHYNRIIWDSIRAISTDENRNNNEKSVSQIFGWTNENRFAKDFIDYFNGLNTFPELVEQGILLYNDKQYQKSRDSFLESITLEDENFIPYYYLGLISYNQKDYPMADFYYNSAIQLNGDESLCNYALGINAYASSDFNKVESYFNQSLKIDDQFTEKINEIQAMILSQKEINERVQN